MSDLTTLMVRRVRLMTVRYSMPSPAKALVNRVLLRIVRKPANRLFLDAGCASFKNAGFFVGGNYIGVDGSLDAIKSGYSKTERGVAQGSVAQIQNLPFRDEAFDVVICTHTLDHLTLVEAASATSELTRVLKAQGTLLINFPKLYEEIILSNLPVSTVLRRRIEYGTSRSAQIESCWHWLTNYSSRIIPLFGQGLYPFALALSFFETNPRKGGRYVLLEVKKET